MVRGKRPRRTDKSEKLEEFPVGKHFFKILAEDFDSQLVIPPKYVQNLETSSQQAILKGPSNNSWHVEFQKNEFGIAITEGWRLFCAENSLKLGDFLVFRYEGDMQFRVQIFDRNACEREDALNVNKELASFRSCEGEDDTPKTSQDSQKSWSDAPKPKKRKCTKQKRSDGPREQFKIFSQRRAITDHERRKTIDAANSFESDLPYCRVVMRKHHVNYFFFVGALGSWQPNFADAPRWLPVAPIVSWYNTITQLFRLSFPGSLWAAPPLYIPYLAGTTATEGTWPTALPNIPATFRNQHLPFEEANLSLLDPRGQSWKVHYVSLNPKTRGLCGGWVPFLTGNNIEEGDVCIFELIEPKKLRVHIFRVVEEVVPLLKRSDLKC